MNETDYLINERTFLQITLKSFPLANFPFVIRIGKTTSPINILYFVLTNSALSANPPY